MTNRRVFMINYENFDQIKELPSMKLRKSDIYTGKAIEFMDKISSSRKGIMKNGKNYALFLANVVKALYYEDKDKNARIQELARTLEIDPKYIAGDLNDFLQSSDSIRIYADDFVYSSVFDNKDMSSLELIGGNANLLALQNLSRLSNLKCVTGNMQLQCSAEEFRNLFPNLVYVGGTIVDLQGHPIIQDKSNVKILK